MKNFKSHIIGVLVGLLSFALYVSFDFIAFGEVTREEMEETFVLNDISWSDVFGPSSDSYDLYDLIYYENYQNPQADAMKDIAKNYGLTFDEARQISLGSFSAVYHNSDVDENVTLEQAYQKYFGIIDEYNSLKELYDLEMQLNSFSEANEIFADGDRLNSGFDLIYDLDQIEDILFNAKTPVTTGTFNPFEDGGDETLENLPDFSSTLFDPLEKENEINSDKIERNTNIESTFEEEQDELEDAEFEDEFIGIDEDICEEDSDLLGALNDFEESYEDEEDLELNENDTNNNDNNNANNDENTINVDNENSYNNSIEPLPASDWKSTFCAGVMPESGKTDNGIEYVFGSSGFESLSAMANGALDETLGYGIGAQTSGFSSTVKFMFCLSTEMVYADYGTIYPDGSCIQCEVDKINANLDEILSHSLIPNKVTGNYMESALCKDAFVPLLDMKIVTIAAPVTTPANTDLIADENIYEDWNTFIDRYRPFLGDFGKLDSDVNENFVLKNIPDGSSIAEAQNEINKINANILGDAIAEIENLNYISTAENINSHYSALMPEVQEMKNLFNSIDIMLTKASEESCQMIIEKPNIQ